MIITIGGRAGSGKSTIVKLLAKKLDLNHYSIGDLQRNIAREKGVSLLELSKMEEEDPSIDKELDDEQKRLGEDEDNFAIDGRLCHIFIPNAKKVFLDASESIRANRLLGDNREGKDLKEIKSNMSKREASEVKRFKEYYDVDPYDKSKYDIVINTDKLSPEEIVEEIVNQTK